MQLSWNNGVRLDFANHMTCLNQLECFYSLEKLRYAKICLWHWLWEELMCAGPPPSSGWGYNEFVCLHGRNLRLIWIGSFLLEIEILWRLLRSSLSKIEMCEFVLISRPEWPDGEFIFYFWPFTTTKSCPIAYFYINSFIILPNTKQNLIKWPKIFNMLPMWRNFGKSGHTDTTPPTCLDTT